MRSIRLRPLALGCLLLFATAAAPDPARAEPVGPGGGEGRVRVVAIGHIVLGTDTPKRWRPRDEGRHLFDALAPVLQAGDIALGNVAGVFATGGVERRHADDAHAFSFRMSPALVPRLVEAGLDVVQVANNHALDFGDAAFDESVGHLRAAGLDVIGLVGAVHRETVHGVRVAIVGFTQPYREDFASHLDVERAGDVVAALAAEADVVVACFHGGGEGAEALHTPDRKEYLATSKEYRGNVVELARTLVDRGASLVVGFGAHHVRAMEWYRGRLIAYALGNGVTYGPFNLRSPNRMAAALDVTFGADGGIEEARIHPFLLRYPGFPVPDGRGWTYSHVRRLSRADFPASGTRVLADGRLVPPDAGAREQAGPASSRVGGPRAAP